MSAEFTIKLKSAIEHNLPFALFRKPNEDLVYLMVDDYTDENRFVLHSFDSQTQKCISDNHPMGISSMEFEFDFELNLPSAPEFYPKTEKEYRDLIQYTVDSIRNSST